MSLTERPRLNGSSSVYRDYWIAVGGGLIGTSAAGLQLSLDLFPTWGPVVLFTSVLLASFAFTDAYVNARILDEGGR